ncbi:MAG: hypothetical protein HQL95_00250 [Magnetococcales bacterium]|nr:hypothetical protein [Magnetococcales bacterium]
MLIASGPVGGVPTGGQAGGARVSSALESPYGPARVNASTLDSAYGTLYAKRCMDYQYGNSPIASWLEQPLTFTVDSRLDASWTLMAKMDGQQVQTWTSTVTVASHCTERYELLVRDPVSSSFTQIWNLSDDRTIRLSGSAVRAFHLGQLV